MRTLFTIALFTLCFNNLPVKAQAINEKSKHLDSLFSAYYEEGLRLSPLFATLYGDNRYNDQLPAEFTDSYNSTNKNYYSRYLSALSKIKRQNLSETDRLSYDILLWEIKIKLEGLSLKSNRMPFNQFESVPLVLGQAGSGSFVQPFKTVTDYNNWIKRVTGFAAWADSAIIYFRKGIAEGIVLPKVLVEKMITQMNSFVVTDPTKSVFYGPITNLPGTFSEIEKQQLTQAYIKMINEQLVPTYKKLGDFLQTEYLPKSRASSGLAAIPGGDDLYKYNLRLITTTNISAEEIYTTGLAEITRITGEMEKLRLASGFEGDLKAFRKSLSTDPKYFPYKTPEEVLAAYKAIQHKIEPNLHTIFLKKPKTPFEVRQTEAFRAATASAQYIPGLADGSRPGIFYIPIIDAAKSPLAAETLFAHEAIPGHHYQTMLQYENMDLPPFRRNKKVVAFSEGWGLYSESLGKDIGLYKDVYQQMRNLSAELHRAVRLVVDPGIHKKGWTREQAIQYMVEHGNGNERGATAEVERYMAIPGQAVAYKVGEMKLLELRKKYEKQLGANFNIAEFHDQILKDGAIPLDILDAKMEAWAKKKRK